MNTDQARYTLAICGAAVVIAVGATIGGGCSTPAEEGEIIGIESQGEGRGCEVTIAGDGGEGTDNATHMAPPRFCAAAQEGDHAEFEDGEAELNFADEDDD